MVAVGGDGRVNVQITWPKVLTIAAAILVAVGGGYWALLQTTLNAFDQRLADASQGIQGNEEEARSIRAFAEATNAALRAEFVESRRDLGDQLGKLGDRIVTANEQLGTQIERLRTELVGSMERRDGALDQRFNRLEQKMDTMLTRITFEPAIQAPAGTYMIDEKGNLLGEKGDFLGTLPAVLNPTPGKP